MLEGAEPLLLAGAGKMGGALLDGWLDRGVDARRIVVLDPHLEQARHDELSRLGVKVAARAAEVDRETGDLRVLVLAVKPQAMPEVLPAVAPLAAPGTVVVSVAAGTRLAALEAAFPPGQPVVRTMPNTPAQVGRGMTVACPNAHVGDAGRAAVDGLLAAVGQVAWITDEALLDAVTAVSGSGPAYVFLLAECLAAAGRRAGLPDDLADLLGRQTVAGAGALLEQSPMSPAVLRRNVTSPNGTTAAALDVLMAEDGLEPLIGRAVAAARARAQELG